MLCEILKQIKWSTLLVLVHWAYCSEASHTFSKVNSTEGTSLFPQQSAENQISGSPTSIKKSPVLRPACHATPPSSTDSKYCKAGKAGVGVNSSIGVSALKINTTLKKESYGVLVNTTWLKAHYWPFKLMVKKWWVLKVRGLCLRGYQDAGNRVQSLCSSNPQVLNSERKIHASLLTQTKSSCMRQ